MTDNLNNDSSSGWGVWNTLSWASSYVMNNYGNQILKKAEDILWNGLFPKDSENLKSKEIIKYDDHTSFDPNLNIHKWTSAESFEKTAKEIFKKQQHKEDCSNKSFVFDNSTKNYVGTNYIGCTNCNNNSNYKKTEPEVQKSNENLPQKKL